MSIRMPRVCLWLLVLIGSLALPCLVSAKPPDLPIDLEDMLPPQMTPERNGSDVLCPLPEMSEPPTTGAPLLEVLHPQFPPPPQQVWQPNEEGMVVVPAGGTGIESLVSKQPRMGRLRPMVRRELASCILFGVHPLLVLAPVDQLVAEKQPFGEVVWSCYTWPNRTLFDVLVKRHAGLTGQQPCPLANATKPMVFTCPFLGAEFRLIVQQDSSNPHMNALTEINTGLTGSMVITGMSCCDLAASERPDGKTEEPRAPCVCPNATEPAPSAESECPYMRQQHQCQPAAVEPQMANDALTNLQNLIDAEKLFQVAEDLRQRGQVSEALGCYELVRKLCPGSRFDTMANEGMDRIFVGSHGVGEEAETVTGEQKKSVPATVKVVKDNCAVVDDFLRVKVVTKLTREEELKRTLNAPASLNYTDAPLSQLIDDIRSWKGINIVVDTPALQDAGICLEQPVSIRVEAIALKSALHLVLHNARLGFVIKDEVLLITTEKKAYARHKKAEAKVGQLPPGVAEEVTSLMKACRLAMETGQHKKAAQLAREAYALAPDRVQADPLVYKMHLLTCKPKVGSAECSEPVCPNGCTKEKCGAGCPKGCAEPCGNSKCQCHEQATGCCTAKKKCQKCCGSGCTPCTDKPAQGCPACQKKASAKGCCDKGCCDKGCCDKGCCEKCSGDKGCCDKDCCDEGCCDEGCPKCKKGPCQKGSCPADSGCGHCPVNNMPPPHCPPQSRRQTGFIEPSLPPLDPELIKGLNKVLEQVEIQQAEDLTAVIEEEEAPPMPQQPVAEQQFFPGCYQEVADAGQADNWWADLRKLLGNITCADLATSPEQVRASCQFKIGDKVIQFRYGPTGLNIEVQPVETAEDVGEFTPVD